jgi:hypothetical protein
MKLQSSESKIRMIAFLVMLLGMAYAWSAMLWIPVFLVADFFLRSFNLGRYSPLAVTGGWLAEALRFSQRPVYMPPKRFAARIGLSLNLLIVAFALAQISTIIPVSILIFFAALESLLGFCAGCYVYDYLQRLKRAAPFSSRR